MHLSDRPRLVLARAAGVEDWPPGPFEVLLGGRLRLVLDTLPEVLILPCDGFSNRDADIVRAAFSALISLHLGTAMVEAYFWDGTCDWPQRQVDFGRSQLVPIVWVDPPDCGCTDCLVGSSRPAPDEAFYLHARGLHIGR